MPVQAYRARTIDGLLAELLSELPAVLVTGPRATGKTTTAERHAAAVVRLDRPAEAAAFRADPDAALAQFAEPLLLDEWQEVPDVLGAVKRTVDQDPRPGRFILTGSVRADLQTTTWPGTGRVVRLPMYGMTVREQIGGLSTRPLLDRLVARERIDVPGDPPDLPEYIRMALVGGFPEAALHMEPTARMHWLAGYVDQLLTRDAEELEPRRDPARLRRYFEAYALNTAGLVGDTTLFEAAGVDRRTALAYERLLTNLFVIDALPAWTSNRLKRLALRPKRYVVDPALAAAALGLDAQAVLREGDLLGRLLDTFAVAQLRAELTASAHRPRLYHLREEHGRHEVDVLTELAGTNVIAFEVKADAAPTRESARHLVWLKEHLGKRFMRGVVFHTGPRAFELAEDVLALPVCTLWG